MAPSLPNPEHAVVPATWPQPSLSKTATTSSAPHLCSRPSCCTSFPTAAIIARRNMGAMTEASGPPKGRRPPCGPRTRRTGAACAPGRPVGAGQVSVAVGPGDGPRRHAGRRIACLRAQWDRADLGDFVEGHEQPQSSSCVAGAFGNDLSCIVRMVSSGQGPESGVGARAQGAPCTRSDTSRSAQYLRHLSLDGVGAKCWRPRCLHMSWQRSCSRDG